MHNNGMVTGTVGLLMAGGDVEKGFECGIARLANVIVHTLDVTDIGLEPATAWSPELRLRATEDGCRLLHTTGQCLG